MNTIPQTNGGRITVVAVHGTFAEDAPWTKPTSDFREMIQRHLPDETLDWIPFPWSGKNTHEARQIAATKLADQIATISLLNPLSRIYLLCHSHGGNIGLMALSWNAHARSRVSGIACMATPFIRQSLSQLSSRARELDQVSPRYFVVSFCFLAVLAWISELSWHIRLPLIFICLGAAVWVPRLLVRFRQAIHTQNLERIQSYYAYNMVKCPVLAIRVTFDEALWGLKSILGLAQSATLAHRITSSLLVLLLLGLVAMPVFVIVHAIVAIVSTLIGTPLPRWMGEFVQAWFLLGLVSVFVVPLLLFLVRLIRAALRFGPVLFGEGLALMYLSMFSCEAWPQGPTKLRKVVLRPAMSLASLRHSHPYGSDACAKEIVAFMRASSNAKRAA